MPTYPFYQIDAFTSTPLGGNPCAVIMDCRDLSDETRLRIAKENNLSETAFVYRPEPEDGDADWVARYWTPAEEIPLAGHPTISTIHALIDTGRLKLTPSLTVVRLALKVGIIRVEVSSTGPTAKDVRSIVMYQKKPQFLSTHDPSDVLPAFGLPLDACAPGYPIQTVSTGTPQLMVFLKDAETLRRAVVDVPRYAALRARAHFFSPHLFVARGATEAGHTFARHFGVPPDTMEDPFTGSATGGMAAYLVKHGVIPTTVGSDGKKVAMFKAEQGHDMGRPGEADVQVVVGTDDDIETVAVGGTAVTIIRGELLL
ncbi:phenazine biosynthesis protein PhzF family [Gonapodya prolifera JEL478]|uniref:Phenazine biosynthesis protein PhzF family n=1 Tax=Gonapodya prolifera (strain JEL478) TaxID=1344416 RepID=A0A138ZYI6_GONPJ|nr:phenazine biosynthesis protein PhzF family [Gonapodya prolifera JEL478]|eukprot:KXS09564.1 phenazine biosynthesis protein PhzF family [Gonapodya prolifera JEL478]